MLTRKQAEVLAFIEGYQADNPRISPSYQEIADGTSMSGKSHVGPVLEELELRGFIRRPIARGTAKTRCIELVDRSPLAHVSTDELRAELARRGAA